jgi:hypothetical protein
MNGDRAMRSLATSLATLSFLILATMLAATKPGCASTVINACGRFSFWVPDDWTMTKENPVNVERSTFESRDGNLYVLVGPLPDKSAELSDDDVTDFVDEEFDDMKVTADKTTKLDNMDVRLVEGTGTDEGDPIMFKMLALDGGSDEGVLVAVVSGSAKDMARSANQSMIEQILHSLKPQNSAKPQK